jgi:hypothetical protein
MIRRLAIAIIIALVALATPVSPKTGAWSFGSAIGCARSTSPAGGLYDPSGSVAPS